MSGLEIQKFKERFLPLIERHKKVLLLLMLTGVGGSASVLVARRVAGPRVSQFQRGDSTQDVSGVFSRGGAPSRDEDRDLPPELAARSGFKRRGGSYAAAVSPEKLGSSPSRSPSSAFPFESGERAAGPSSSEQSSLDMVGWGSGNSASDANNSALSGPRGGPASSPAAPQTLRALQTASKKQGPGSDNGEGAASDSSPIPDQESSGPQMNAGTQEDAGESAKSGPQTGFGSRFKSVGKSYDGKSARSRKVSGSGKKAAVKKYKGITGWMVDEIKKRAGISYGDSGSYDNAEIAKGVQNAAWSESQGSGQAVGGFGPGGSGGGGVSFQGMDGLSGTPKDLATQAPSVPAASAADPKKIYGWWFKWEPMLIIGDYNKAEEDIASLWNIAGQKDLSRLGQAGVMDVAVGRLINDWAQNLPLWEQALGYVTAKIGFSPGLSCVSVRPDIAYTLSYEGQEIGYRVENCAEKSGLPLPYVLRSCVIGTPDSSNHLQGYETTVPLNYKSMFPKELPDVLKPTTPPQDQQAIDAGAHVVSVPSNLYRRNIQDQEKDPWKSSDPANAQGKQELLELLDIGMEHVGFGVFRLRFGFCVGCDQPYHPSYWPAVYFNPYRDFDGAGRCLPAGVPGVEERVKCAIMGNREFANKCNLKCLAKFKDNPKFRKFMKDVGPGVSTDQACDKRFRIHERTQDCVETGQWPGAEPPPPQANPDCEGIEWPEN